MVTNFPIIDSVLNGNQQGKIFDVGTCRFIQHKSGFSYFNGEGKSNNELLVETFASNKNILQYFHLYDAKEDLIQLINKDKRFEKKIRKRIRFHFKRHRINNKLLQIDGFYFLNNYDVDFSSLKEFNLNFGGKFWNNESDFLKYSQFKVLFNQNHNPASICYAAAISNGIAEIDIATTPKWRSIGLAKVVCQEFIYNCLNLRIIPSWDCFASNTASMKTARSLGFEVIKEYSFLSIYRK